MPARNHIAVIARTLRVVEAFNGRDAITLGELVATTRLVKSSVFRILYTLIELGYVEKDGRGRYLLTPQWTKIARTRRPNVDLVRLSAPLIGGLLGLFHETVNLGVLEQGEVLYIHVLESPHAFRLAAHAGMRSPVHSTALGKCLLCKLSTEALEAILRRHPLRALTKRTVRDRASLLRELRRVRERGYAVDAGEDSPGARCIAAPITDGTGRVVAAISISGPASRIHRGRDREMSTALMEVCAQISKRLSFVVASEDDPPLGGS
jgi:IclR family transcriptional regulator, KDG regulon repressor